MARVAQHMVDRKTIIFLERLPIRWTCKKGIFRSVLIGEAAAGACHWSDMPAPYSQDLRERVIGFMALGGSARAAVTRFEVSIAAPCAGRSAGGPKALHARA
jgi:hypothetical protein